MKPILWMAALSALMLSALAPAAWAQGEEVTVGMEDNYFDAKNITVEPGTTVTWVQRGQYGHTTTSYDGLWDSGLIEGDTDGTFSYTFEDPGTYEYFCGPHEEMGMVGTVTVTDDGSASASASASATASASASAEAETLTDTGGPPLALAAAILLVASGILSFAVLRRRSS